MSFYLWRSRRDAVVEGLILVVLAAANVVLGLTSHHWVPGRGTSHWAELVLEVALIATMVLRRRYPGVFVAITLFAVGGTLLWHQLVRGSPFPISGSTDLWIPVLLSNVGVTVVAADFRRRWQWTAWVLAGLITLISVQPWAMTWGTFTNGLATTASPLLFGLFIGVRMRLTAARKGLVEALKERAERAEREQSLLAEQARADERARLASEMHDVVSHRVSLMVLQAGALRTVAPDDATRAAADELRASGSQALEELRDLVGVLRAKPADGDGDELARPGAAVALPDLSTLAAESESVGVPVELVTEGNPTLTSPVVGRTAYQVVREALTNVRKHAPGAKVRVHVRYGADRLRLTIRNQPSPRAADPGLAETGSGSGLYGLQQRVELVGGTLDTGATADGGFEVDAILPAYVPTAAARAARTSGGKS